jgi:hypothetical protein
LKTVLPVDQISIPKSSGRPSSGRKLAPQHRVGHAITAATSGLAKDMGIPWPEKKTRDGRQLWRLPRGFPG